MTPSWRLHRKFGEEICEGFSEKEIDAIIDSKEKHDAGRYDASILKKQLKEVYERWGYLGALYYLSHHVLDRLSEILVSVTCTVYEMHVLEGVPIEEAYKMILIGSWNQLLKELRDWVPEEEKWKEAIRDSLNYILAALEVRWEEVIKEIFFDEDFRGIHRIENRILVGMFAKSYIKFRMRYGINVGKNEVMNFLAEIKRLLGSKCEEFEKSRKRLKEEGELLRKRAKAIFSLQKLFEGL